MRCKKHVCIVGGLPGSPSSVDLNFDLLRVCPMIFPCVFCAINIRCTWSPLSPGHVAPGTAGISVMTGGRAGERG